MKEPDYVGSILAIIARNDQLGFETIVVANSVWDKLVDQLGRLPTAEDFGHPIYRHPLMPTDQILFGDITEFDILRDVRAFTEDALKND